MCEITITTEDGRIAVRSPYHPKFPTRAKQLGGKWDGARKVWTFDPRDEDRVRTLVRDIYGHDGSGDVELVTLRIDACAAPDLWSGTSAWLAGREIAHRGGRDYPVRLGDGVIVAEGPGFDASGGSRRYPKIDTAREGTILEVRDVPLPLALEAVRERPDAVSIVEHGESVSEVLRQINGGV